MLRYAITVWYFDAEERAQAKQKYKKPCDAEEKENHVKNITKLNNR